MTDTTVASSAPRLYLIPVEAPKPKHIRRHRSRLFKGLLILVMGVILFLTGGVGSTASTNASAFDLFNTCSSPEEWAQNPSMSGWPGMLDIGSTMAQATTSWVDPYQVDFTKEYVYPKDNPTAYEWYGTAGLTWDVNNVSTLVPVADCGAGSLVWKAGNTVANLFWQMSVLIGGLIIFLYSIASAPDIMNLFLAPLDTMLTSAKDSFFLAFLTPMVILAALWIAYKGLFKKRSSEAVQGAIWVVISACAVISFLVAPTWFVSRANWVVGAMQNAVMATVTYPTTSTGSSTTPTSTNNSSPLAGSNNTADQMCYAGPVTTSAPPASSGSVAAPSTTSYSLNTTASRNFQCLMWQVFLFEPWSSGYFGQIGDDKISKDQLVTIAGRPIANGNSLNMVLLDSVTFNHNDTVGDWRKKQQDAMAQKKDLRDKAMTYMQDTFITPKYYPQGLEDYVGKRSGDQIPMALLALTAILFGGVPIVILSMRLLFYQFMFVIMLMLAPIYLTVGIHPGFGRGIALGWLEYIINLSIKRIAVVALLSAMMVLLQIIVRA